MSIIKVRIKLEEEMLGTSCNDRKVHEKYIARNSEDAKKMQEEIEALPVEEQMALVTTVFPRDKDGFPFMYDYQFKGFLKESIGILLELSDKETKIGKTKLSKWTFKRIVDNYVFVYPRIIKLPPCGLPCTRPLRAMTPQGERIALVTSETVPALSEFEVEIKTLTETLDKLVYGALDYGALKGLMQWRNSGKGRFTWKEIK